MSYDQGRDLEPEAFAALRQRVEELLAGEGVDGVAAVLYDDRQRAVDEGQRNLSTGAAALAQEHLKIADELMRMAGNGVHNSPNGFDRVAEEVLDATMDRSIRAMGQAMRLRVTLREWVRRGGWRDR